MTSFFMERFDDHLPIVVDIETGGLNPLTDAVLYVSAVLLTHETGLLKPFRTFAYPIHPFEGARLTEEAFQLHGIDPHKPTRIAETEEEFANKFFREVRKALVLTKCRQAILVGQNANFDLSFLKALAKRTGFEDKFPFHPYRVLDTVSYGVLAYGKTNLADIAVASGIEFNKALAHNAVYDAEVTANIFCAVFNSWGKL